jgi:hypothetical protein
VDPGGIPGVVSIFPPLANLKVKLNSFQRKYSETRLREIYRGMASEREICTRHQEEMYLTFERIP